MIPPAVRPLRGAFDVMVVQSSPLAGIVDTGNLLTNKPVYTVYIKPGTRKHWILQYCTPRAAPPQRPSGIVSAGGGSPVKAPFPISTALPPGFVSAASGYTVFKARLDSAGHFHGLLLVRGDDAQFAELKSFLEKWEFYPALLDERPVEVEILIAIPPGGF